MSTFIKLGFLTVYDVWSVRPIGSLDIFTVRYVPLTIRYVPDGQWQRGGEALPGSFQLIFCHIWHNLSNWHSPCLRFVTCNLRKYLHKRCLRCRNAVFSISSTYPCSLVRNSLILSDYIIQLPLVTDSRRKEYSKCILCPWAPFHFNFYLQFNLYDWLSQLLKLKSLTILLKVWILSGSFDDKLCFVEFRFCHKIYGKKLNNDFTKRRGVTVLWIFSLAKLHYFSNHGLPQLCKSILNLWRYTILSGWSFKMTNTILTKP